MAVPVASNDPLLTEHLTYRPITLIDDIIDSINELSYKATTKLEQALLSADPANLGFKLPPAPPNQSEAESKAAVAELQEKCKHEIENGVHQFETLLDAKIDKNFDRLEIYALRNILSVPPEVRDWVRLEHYEGLSFSNVGAEEGGHGANRESVREQRRRLRETQKLGVLLKLEKERNEATLASLQKLVPGQGKGVKAEQDVEMEGARHGGEDGNPAFAFLQDKGELNGDGKEPITASASFALSQLPALHSLLDNLQERLNELANGNGSAGMVGEEEKTFRRQRVEFIENETRRHLEQVRGLELGEQGAVRDGEWQGEGRTLAKGEVENLERVVEMIGDSSGGDAMDTT